MRVIITKARRSTQIEMGRSAKRVNKVTSIIVVEYGGSGGGMGKAIAKSRKPSHRLWIKKRLLDGKP